LEKNGTSGGITVQAPKTIDFGFGDAGFAFQPAHKLFQVGVFPIIATWVIQFLQKGIDRRQGILIIVLPDRPAKSLIAVAIEILLVAGVDAK
jgi:hypothetical protein